MSGREAIRGFAVQTLICLLDSFWASGQWNAVTLEPDSENDKVDIHWEYADGSTCAQQVKSSKNQIGKGDVVAWCRELKASNSANRYQLMLAGPIAAAVLEAAPFDGVDVPTPTSMDTLALLDQAITKVDRYLTAKSIDPLPLPLRESLIYELVARMMQAAIHGKRMLHEEFDGWLLSGITASYPHAVSQRLTANCAVLWSVLEIAGPIVVSTRAFELILPLTVVNGGASTAIVEMFLLRVWSTELGREMRYRPESIVSEGIEAGYDIRRRSGYPFGDFAISPQSSVKKSVLFVPVQRPGYDVDQWPLGDYQVELFVKYAAQVALCSVKKTAITIGMDAFSVLTSGQTGFISVSNLDRYLSEILTMQCAGDVRSSSL
ncbi:hypothetical protein LYZ86_11040 [Xanthomonas hortorum pv. cynarae]|uniref:hypothetical protein n=1 Tax=Xanthomonas hortorum TaxID=56454 RepID=UPI000CEDD08A|nr:hypothetical protein [Xanthomonas hortorum]MCE4349798.1 hypothetical protein [Xanthomonas hortorum pv. cynarae]PPU43054.1 hypothetical protein XcyCFBP4188_12035 [Xanthomonas hortorum pv. cynarae]CAD0303734.1 hypothetical protein CFBP2044_05000 [Xanthomonas hortorum pv. cynarae]CAD0303742.1 hypothetical protein CFBP2044_05000 [Xanthomonas hortorum pv. cynarae]